MFQHKRHILENDYAKINKVLYRHNKFSNQLNKNVYFLNISIIKINIYNKNK